VWQDSGSRTAGEDGIGYRLSGWREKTMTGVQVVLESTITCPQCGFSSKEIMPTDACQFFYDCKGCGAVLKPRPGDCCVFCSYGSVKCPPIQAGQGCCVP
jgi:hypothetical protein